MPRTGFRKEFRIHQTLPWAKSVSKEFTSLGIGGMSACRVCKGSLHQLLMERVRRLYASQGDQ